MGADVFLKPRPLVEARVTAGIPQGPAAWTHTGMMGARGPKVAPPRCGGDRKPRPLKTTTSDLRGQEMGLEQGTSHPGRPLPRGWGQGASGCRVTARPWSGRRRYTVVTPTTQKPQAATLGRRPP